MIRSVLRNIADCGRVIWPGWWTYSKKLTKRRTSSERVDVSRCIDGIPGPVRRVKLGKQQIKWLCWVAGSPVTTMTLYCRVLPPFPCFAKRWFMFGVKFFNPKDTRLFCDKFQSRCHIWQTVLFLWHPLFSTMWHLCDTILVQNRLSCLSFPWKIIRLRQVLSIIFLTHHVSHRRLYGPSMSLCMSSPCQTHLPISHQTYHTYNNANQILTTKTGWHNFPSTYGNKDGYHLHSGIQKDEWRHLLSHDSRFTKYTSWKVVKTFLDKGLLEVVIFFRERKNDSWIPVSREENTKKVPQLVGGPCTTKTRLSQGKWTTNDRAKN